MREVLDLIKEYHEWFYLITFIWTAVEGETFVIFAALAAQKGYLNIGALFLAAWLGSSFGDQIFFFIGRYFGTRIIARYPKQKPKVDKALGWLEKYATLYILSYRFMYGIRNVSGIAVGMSRLPWKRFAWLNLTAAFIWAFAFCGAGYFFGDLIQHLGKRKEEVVGYSVREFMLTSLGLFAFIIAIRLWVVYRDRSRAKKQAEIDILVGPDITPGID